VLAVASRSVRLFADAKEYAEWWFGGENRHTHRQQANDQEPLFHSMRMKKHSAIGRAGPEGNSTDSVISEHQ
jgi:hypothetical protein